MNDHDNESLYNETSLWPTNFVLKVELPEAINLQARVAPQARFV